MIKNYKQQVYLVQVTMKHRPLHTLVHLQTGWVMQKRSVASARRGSEGGGSKRESHSSSRLSSLPLQISHTSNSTTNANPKQPRDPSQPARQDHAEIDPPSGFLQPIERQRHQRLFRLSIRIVYLERRVDIGDGGCDGPKTGRKTVLVEAVA